MLRESSEGGDAHHSHGVKYDKNTFIANARRKYIATFHTAFSFNRSDSNWPSLSATEYVQHAVLQSNVEVVSGHIARGSVNGQRHKKTLSMIWSVSSHKSASSKGKLCCRQKNHQKAASLSAVLCAVQLNRLS